MPFITSDQIRDISVKTVEMFLNNKVPLSEGLAKQASVLELNSDQIQRAVEATNSIAYLKVLSLAEDRTVEFPLCKFAEVMTSIAVPDLTKAASIEIYKGSAAGKSTDSTETLVEAVYGLNSAEERVMLTKLASINEKELETLRDREVTIMPELTKVAEVIRKDPQGLEKLASVSQGKEFAVASVLVYNETKTYADTGIFKEAELKDAEKLIGLLKEASVLTEQIKQKSELAEKSELVKQAFFGALGGAIGRGIGTAIKAPIKALAAGTKAVANSGGSAVAHAVKPTGFQKAMKVGGVGMAVGGAAVDASMYKPGRDVITGRSKDVWTALQKESY